MEQKDNKVICLIEEHKHDYNFQTHKQFLELLEKLKTEDYNPQSPLNKKEFMMKLIVNNTKQPKLQINIFNIVKELYSKDLLLEMLKEVIKMTKHINICSPIFKVIYCYASESDEDELKRLTTKYVMKCTLDTIGNFGEHCSEYSYDIMKKDNISNNMKYKISDNIHEVFNYPYKL